MILKSLSVIDFKNIESAELEFSPNINCFLGNNGMGKSNLLDALYFMSYCRSFTGVADSLLVRRGATAGGVRGRYFRRGLDEEISASVRGGQRKIFKRSGKPYQRLSEHLGLFPAVLLSPADMELSSGEPAERRRFLDQIISQQDAVYLTNLMNYNATLEQRNRLLKDESSDWGLFDTLEMQLEYYAEYIIRRRHEAVEHLQAIFTPYYRTISGGAEEPLLKYSTSDYSAVGGLAEHLKNSRRRDFALHHTASGPHRDDLEMTLDGLPVRRTASQGQTKTFTTALRFAQYELLRESLGVKPLLLLDDIFDKLDANRVEAIISLVGNSESFGQIFITDTNRRHLDEIVAMLANGQSYRLWEVDGGHFTPLHS